MQFYTYHELRKLVSRLQASRLSGPSATGGQMAGVSAQQRVVAQQVVAARQASLQRHTSGAGSLCTEEHNIT